MATESQRITTGGKEYLPRASEVLGRIFRDDPAVNYMLSSMAPEPRAAYLPLFVGTLLETGALNAGEFEEIDDWSCVALWIPEGRSIDGLGTMIRVKFHRVLFKTGLSGLKRMALEFGSQAAKFKKQNLKGRKYHYLFWIGTDEKARGKGLASKIITEYQKKAARDGYALWLEASTKHSRGVYAKSGFRCVGEIQLGVGTHAANGEKHKGGPGVIVYPMMWEPEQFGKEPMAEKGVAANGRT